MPADIVIRGGSVVDGTGAPARIADVAITDGVISDIGDGLDGRRVLEAGGNVVTPGFVDIHTHYDAQVFWDPALTPSCWHGVTSVVAGNCGFSIAPVRPEHRELLVRTLQHVEDMAPDTLFEGVPWTEFETFPQYFEAIERRGTLLNYACYVGHTAVRIYVMGEAGYEKEATDDDISGMQRVIAGALDAGAAGFATSASPTHNGDRGRPVPSRIAGLDEVRALVQPLHDAHKGVGRAASGREGHPRRRLRRAARRGPSGHVDRVAHGQGIPLAREDHGGEHPGPRRGRRGVAAGLVPSLDLPDEPSRAVHVQHAAHVPGADGSTARGAIGGVPRSGVAIPRGTSSRVAA